MESARAGFYDHNPFSSPLTTSAIGSSRCIIVGALRPNAEYVDLQ